MKQVKGFTLIELMVVVAIIGILASVAMPQYQMYIHRSEVVDALTFSTSVREKVASYHAENLGFPANNTQAGVPAPELLIGNRVTSITVEAGAIHIQLGNKSPKPLHGKTLTFRPAVVIGSVASPMSWLCGYDEPVPGMKAVGQNKTDIPNELLPSACRNKLES
ncbi:pilin [Parendozoicomonas haliclonae]|uniref:Fimbrial protein n=1 Tax=Parendozoicomonas haliclonae TaxID=1960125 RepID=A0A1X7AGJ5_9GAMM|nr:pilin [Parendozoicomonas haliclonae]SMA40131.1 Fimbrial protein precursor [Parendozoicomonas haliclonae]